MLTFLEIARSLRPRWVVWENVPGVLSSNGGRDFGSFLGALGELGYGWAYRVLDAQWFGVAQRRRRVFVVGHLGNWELAAKVLFESESVRRDTPPSREARQGASANAQEGVGAGGIAGGFRMRAFGEYSDDGTASAMKARDYKDATDLVAEKKSHWEGSGVHPTLNQSFNTGAIGYSNQELFSQGGSGLVQSLYENHPNDSRVTGPHDVAPSCVSRFWTGGGNVPLVQEAVAFTTEQTPKFNKEQALTLTKQSPSGGGQPQCVMAVDVYNQTIDGDVAAKLTEAVGGTNTSRAKVMAFHQNASGEVRESESVYALNTNSNPSGRNTGMIQSKMAVRRLTPKECERLQGFPDDHTLIPWRNKPADQCPDGPRYKALGNSMAVPCMAWIGKRIDAADRRNRKANQ